jgi:hypothetical protein
VLFSVISLKIAGNNIWLEGLDDPSQVATVSTQGARCSAPNYFQTKMMKMPELQRSALYHRSGCSTGIVQHCTSRGTGLMRRLPRAFKLPMLKEVFVYDQINYHHHIVVGR